VYHYIAEEGEHL